MLVIAIVVMTVVLLLGLAMTRVLSSSTNTVLYEVLGFRAFNAARSGLESNLASVLNAPPINGVLQDPFNICRNQGRIASNESFSSVSGFENCSYVTSCDVQNFNDPNAQGDYFRFSSTGTCSIDQNNAVSRTVAVDARL
jgi:MSHA biogenesis protein MshP